jgi:hypothetical protein
MPGNIYGDGPRGGVFGARIDPRLVAELEKRAADKRRMAQGLENAAPAEEPSTIGSRAKEWWDKTTFFKPAWNELVGGASDLRLLVRADHGRLGHRPNVDSRKISTTPTPNSTHGP